MPQVEVALAVRVRGAVAVGGVGHDATAADHAIARDAWGRLVLPGSHIKGRLRHACEQVARGVGLASCRAPRAENMCRAAPELSAPCVVCALFGSPAWPSPLRWADLHPDDAPVPGAPASGTAPTRRAGEIAPAALRAGIALDRRRGTVVEGGAFFVETSPELLARGLRFAHERAIRGRLEDPGALHLLLAGCRLVTSFGAGATRGLGWSEVTATARVDDVPLAFDPTVLRHTEDRR